MVWDYAKEPTRDNEDYFSFEAYELEDIEITKFYIQNLKMKRKTMTNIFHIIKTNTKIDKRGFLMSIKIELFLTEHEIFLIKYSLSGKNELSMLKEHLKILSSCSKMEGYEIIEADA